jgi:hypothetical protein
VKSLPSVSPVVATAVRELMENGSELELNVEELEASVKDAVKSAVKEAVAVAVEEATTGK